MKRVNEEMIVGEYTMVKIEYKFGWIMDANYYRSGRTKITSEAGYSIS